MKILKLLLLLFFSVCLYPKFSIAQNINDTTTISAKKSQTINSKEKSLKKNNKSIPMPIGFQKKLILDSLKKENQKKIAAIKQRNKFVADSIQDARLQKALKARAAKENKKGDFVAKKDEAFLQQFITTDTISQNVQIENKKSKKTRPTKMPISINSDDILMDFNSEDYEKIVAESPEYIKKNPSDTNIIIKYGISNLLVNKFEKGFTVIDSVITNKDSLIKFYSILPYINENIKIGDTYEAIINHIDSLLPNGLWTNFSKAVYYNTIDSNSKAEIFAKIMYAEISNKYEFNTMSYIYPSILFDNGKQIEGINILKEGISKYPTAYNAQFTLFQMYKKQKMYIEAYSIISNLILNLPDNDDYYQEKIDLCIEMNRKDEACEMLQKINENGNYDAKVYASNCVNEFTKLPAKTNSIYFWEVNKDGAIDSISASFIKNNADSNFTINYSLSNKSKTQKNEIKINLKLIDTARTLFFITDFKTKIDSTSGSINFIWVSKLVFEEIINNGETMLNLGTGNGIFRVVKENIDNVDDNKFADRILINNTNKKFIETIHLYNSDTYEQIWISKDPKNPLVVKLDVGFTIELKRIDF